MITRFDMPSCVESSAEEEFMSSGEMGSNEHEELCSDEDNKVQRSFYFVKFQSYKDPELESRIKEGFQLVRQIYEAQVPIVEELEKIKMDRDKLSLAIECRRCHYQEEWWLNSWKPEHDRLQLCIQKLSYPNYTEIQKRCQRLSNGLIHTSGARSLVKERKICKEIDQLQRGLGEEVDTIEKEQTEILRWRGFGSKEDCIESMKSEVKTLCAMPKDYAEIKAGGGKGDYGRLLAEKSRVDGELLTLRVKMDGLNRNKDNAYQCILDAQKLLDATKSDHSEYLAIAGRAMEFAVKNNFDALSALSSREIERFMSRWNNNKSFRAMYRKSVAKSLHCRGLDQDGRLKNPDED